MKSNVEDGNLYGEVGEVTSSSIVCLYVGHIIYSPTAQIPVSAAPPHALAFCQVTRHYLFDLNGEECCPSDVLTGPFPISYYPDVCEVSQQLLALSSFAQMNCVVRFGFQCLKKNLLKLMAHNDMNSHHYNSQPGSHSIRQQYRLNNKNPIH